MEQQSPPPWEARPTGIWDTHGNDEVCLSNFTAKISAKIMHDDGADVRMLYQIEVQWQDKRQTIVVPAGQFRYLRWADELGPEYVIYVEGRRHLAVAIQELSIND